MTDCYYKVLQVLQSVSGITKCDRPLLQSASGITKCDRLLLQSASGITKCDSYYKVRRNTGFSPRSVPWSFSQIVQLDIHLILLAFIYQLFKYSLVILPFFSKKLVRGMNNLKSFKKNFHLFENRTTIHLYQHQTWKKTRNERR